MSQHRVTITFDGGYTPELTFACDAPPQALCRAEFACDCEVYARLGVDERGPWHELTEGYMTSDEQAATEPPRHYGSSGGECGQLLYVTESDCAGEVGDGSVTVPIDLTWHDGGCEWHIVGGAS